MNQIIQDLKYGVRTLLQKPGFTLTAVLTLALGIGANTAIFSIINAMLFRPLPMVENPEEIVILANRDAHMEFPHGLSYVDYLDYREQNEVFEELAVYTPLPIGIAGEGRSVRTWGVFVSGGFFDLFGTAALHGTSLSFDDTNPTGGEPVLVLGHTFWQREFDGDPSLVGKPLRVNGRDFTVVGIMPEGFNGSDSIFECAAYAPATALQFVRDDAALFSESRESHIFRAVARLKDGVSVDQARTAMQLIADRLGSEYPDTNADVELIVVLERRARPEPSTYGLMQPILAAFMGLASLVLLIACANVANLLLARGTSRGREMATRTALGAGRGRIVRQLLTETLMLAVAGGVAGIMLAEWISAYVTSLTNNLPVDVPVNFNFRPDLGVYVFALVAAVVACVIAGLVPAWRCSRVNVNEALKDGRTTSAGAGRNRLRKTLVVSQLALSLLLLVCAGLFVRSLINARTFDMGFERGNLLLMAVDPMSQGYDEDRSRMFYEEVLQRVQTLPGVRSASLAGFVPFSGSGLQAANIFPIGTDRPADEKPPTVFFNTVDHHYFHTMGIPILNGRGFVELDTAESLNVVVVNETLARQIWPGEDPIGRQMRLDGEEGDLCEVIGVVKDGKYMAIFEEPRAFMYRPMTQNLPPFAARLHMRTEGDPLSLAPVVRDVVRDIDEFVPIFEVRDMATHLANGNALLPFRMGAMMVGGFGLLGLVLATIGIYGVIAYSVGSRTQEFGVRMALGADRASVLKMVLGEGLVLTGVGALVGLALALLVTQGLKGLLLNVSSFDLVVYSMVTLLLVAIAVVASLIPARRATKIDPMVALRYE